MQAAVAATPAFAFQRVTASAPGRGAREAGSPSAAAYRTKATAINDVSRARKVTTLIDRLVLWVFIVGPPCFLISSWELCPVRELQNRRGGVTGLPGTIELAAPGVGLESTVPGHGGT